MEIIGKIISILEETNGTSKSGNQWRKKEFIIETLEQYSKKVAFFMMNDTLDKNPIAVGEQVTVTFVPESREYQGKWYTSLQAKSIRKEVLPET